MTSFHVALVPVGKLDAAEIEAAAQRAAKVIRQPLELRDSLALPKSSEDAQRGQHRAAVLLERLREDAAKRRPGRMIGAETEDAKTPFHPAAYLFITDVDLFTAKTSGVMAAVNPAGQSGVISLRRIREAFHHRKADPARQRTRLVKEILRMWGRLQGLVECAQPTCALAPSRSVPDIDSKTEGFCTVCSRRLFEGKVQI